ncbi:MAG: outer membrane protein assembly factor BamD [Pirellulaceae bacterium]
MSENRIALWSILASGLCCASGCATLGDASAINPLTGIPAAATSSEEERGLSWSDFSFDNLGKTLRKATGRGPNKDVARALYQAADAEYRHAATVEGAPRAALFEAAGVKFAEAALRWPDSALALDAYFMAGESYFFADNYPDSNYYYEALVKAFPNNKYMDVVDQRRFAIGKYWLDIQRESPEPLYYVNFFDRARPWKDARGHSLRVFDKIRMDDVTGHFSDDATLAVANEHFTRGKYLKADEYYTDLRKTFPTSEHQFAAHFIGLKAKLNSYNGPAYSGAPLDEAEKLIKQMRRQFPQESEQEREFIDKSAAEVRFRKAERLAFLGQYYDRRAEYRAAQHYYQQIVSDYQDTPVAGRAQQRVGEIAGLPPVPAQKAQWLIDLLPESDNVKPLLEATEQVRLADAQRAVGERNAEIQEDLDAGGQADVAGGVISNFLDR